MAGYAMAILSTFALTYLAIQPNLLKFIQKYLDIPGLMLAVPFSIGTGVIWTMFGMLFGSAYKLGGFDETDGFAGAPSWVWLMIIASLAWLPIPVLWLISRRHWWLWLGMSLSFIGCFGWLMPLMAEQ